MPPPGCTQPHPRGHTPDLGKPSCRVGSSPSPHATAVVLFSTSWISGLWVSWASSLPTCIPQSLRWSVDLSHLETSVRSSPQSRLGLGASRSLQIVTVTGRKIPFPAPHSCPGANPAGPLGHGLFFFRSYGLWLPPLPWARSDGWSSQGHS